MSRTRKDAPFAIRRARGQVGPDRLIIRHSDRGAVEYERRRFYTNVSGRDIHEGARVPERQAVRASLRNVERQAYSDPRDVDDTNVVIQPQHRNSTWGGGYFD